MHKAEILNKLDESFELWDLGLQDYVGEDLEEVVSACGEVGGVRAEEREGPLDQLERLEHRIDLLLGRFFCLDTLQLFHRILPKVFIHIVWVDAKVVRLDPLQRVQLLLVLFVHLGDFTLFSLAGLDLAVDHSEDPVHDLAGVLFQVLGQFIILLHSLHDLILHLLQYLLEVILLEAVIGKTVPMELVQIY